MSALLEVDNLTVGYSLGRTMTLLAVNDVSLSLEQGSILGLVGESGCGKSSLGRAIAGIGASRAGCIRVDGRTLGMPRSRSDARLVQMVFQDPSSALNPALSVGATLSELLLVHGLAQNRDEAWSRAESVMRSVDLPTWILDRRSHSLSGGQRQRVSIARALVLEPRILIADEAVAALDAVVKKSIVELLAKLRAETDLSILFISHDLGVVSRLCDEIAVMYLGRIVERQSTADLLRSPRHPYAAGLLAARPHLGRRLDVSTPPALVGDPPSPIDVGSGCSFASRCQLADAMCRELDPPLIKTPERAHVICHHPLPIDSATHPDR